MTGGEQRAAVVVPATVAAVLTRPSSPASTEHIAAHLHRRTRTPMGPVSVSVLLSSLSSSALLLATSPSSSSASAPPVESPLPLPAVAAKEIVPSKSSTTENHPVSIITTTTSTSGNTSIIEDLNSIKMNTYSDSGIDNDPSAGAVAVTTLDSVNGYTLKRGKAITFMLLKMIVFVTNHCHHYYRQRILTLSKIDRITHSCIRLCIQRFLDLLICCF
jgi:hypothetical protein